MIIAWWDKPLATPPYRSYRYEGSYGWIMISAATYAEARTEVGRSTPHPFEAARLQEWDNVKQCYVRAAP